MVSSPHYFTVHTVCIIESHVIDFREQQTKPPQKVRTLCITETECDNLLKKKTPIYLLTLLTMLTMLTLLIFS